jgi:hypothetical protein
MHRRRRVNALAHGELGRGCGQAGPRPGEPSRLRRGPDSAREARLHVDHRGGDGINPREILEAAEHDAVRRRPQQAPDDPAHLLDDDEGGIEAVQARLDTQPSEQAERQIVLRLVSAEERLHQREVDVDVVDPYRL